MGTTRRIVIGGAGLAVLGALGYRAWDRGVFAVGEGEAFKPWQDWRGSADEGAKQPLHAAILAANPHDTQPWLFSVHGASIAVLADRARNLGSFDPFRREMHLGVGCAVENLMRAAAVCGYSMNVIVSGGRLTPSPANTPVRAAHLWLEAAEAVRDPLFEAIPKRHTNRGAYDERPVADADLRKLQALASDKEVRVVFLTDAKAREEMASLIVEATERIIADPQMSGDSARWFRTGRREVDAHRDGIGIDSSGVSRLVAAGAKLMPDLNAATADKTWLSMTRDVQTHAPVLGMILVRDRLEMASAVAAGRAWQRLHLAATTMGLAAQPLNQPVEMVDRNQQLGRDDNFANGLQGLAHAVAWEATFTFRLGYAKEPALPSPRRPLREVLVEQG
jgi:nitroreductase